MRHYFENHGNIAECVGKFRTDFERREKPSAPFVRFLVKKVKETDILLIDKPKREKPKTVRKLRTDFEREEPSAPFVRYRVKKVKETGIFIDKPKREKPKTVRKPENIAAVTESVCEEPSTSIYRRSQQLNISETSLRQYNVIQISIGSRVEAN